MNKISIISGRDHQDCGEDPQEPQERGVPDAGGPCEAQDPGLPQHHPLVSGQQQG